MFWGLSTGVLALGVALVITEAGDRGSTTRKVATGSVLVVLALLFRPVALPLVAFWMIAIATRFGRPLIDRFAPALLVAAVVAAAAAIIAHAYVLVHPSAWPFGSLPGMLTMVAKEYREGMFVHQANPPMLVAPATDVFGFIRITLQKLIFFVTPWLPHYSTAHTLLNLVFFVPAYGLSIAAITNLRRLAPPQQRAAMVLALFVLFVAVFHSMLLHRFRSSLPGAGRARARSCCLQLGSSRRGDRKRSHPLAERNRPPWPVIERLSAGGHAIEPGQRGCRHEAVADLDGALKLGTEPRPLVAGHPV